MPSIMICLLRADMIATRPLMPDLMSMLPDDYRLMPPMPDAADAALSRLC